MSSCGCASGCKCGSGCGCNGCGWFGELGEEKVTTTQSTILGLAPQKGGFEAGVEIGVEGEKGGCKCGSNCTCDPCSCK